jgi:hypothetical protein
VVVVSPVEGREVTLVVPVVAVAVVGEARARARPVVRTQRDGAAHLEQEHIHHWGGRRDEAARA